MLIVENLVQKQTLDYALFYQKVQAPFKVYVVYVCKLLRITSRTNQKE